MMAAFTDLRDKAAAMHRHYTEAPLPPQAAPSPPDYTGVAISQELMAALDRSIGLRRELLAQAARITELEREIAELKKGNSDA